MSQELSSGERNDHAWAVAEQLFMRSLGIALLIIAFVSVIFPAYQATFNQQLVRGMNIALTMILGAGGLWSLYWSSQIDRIYTMLDEFKHKGNAPTYAFAGLQIVIGLMFGSELMAGSIVTGSLGVIMIISGGFFVWRAQQISHYSSKSNA